MVIKDEVVQYLKFGCPYQPHDSYNQSKQTNHHSKDKEEETTAQKCKHIKLKLS